MRALRMRRQFVGAIRSSRKQDRRGLALVADRGTRITVCSFTPSRIAIITSRRSKSNDEVAGFNCAGVSLG